MDGFDKESRREREHVDIPETMTTDGRIDFFKQIMTNSAAVVIEDG